MDETDQAPDAAVSSENVDPLYHGGLRGRRGETPDETYSFGDGLYAAHTFTTEDGSQLAFGIISREFQNGTPVDPLQDYDRIKFSDFNYYGIGTRRGELIAAMASSRICGTDSGGEDKVYFVGRDHEGTPLVTGAEVLRLDAAYDLNVTITKSNTGGELPAGKYFYRASILCEGTQDGPLGTVVRTITTTGSASYVTVSTPDPKSAIFHATYPRASHYRVWRAFSVDTAATVPDTPYRLIASIDDLKADYPATSASKADTIVQSVNAMTVYDYGEDQVGGDYEAVSGLSSAASSSFVHYRLGHLLGQTLFVGQCSKEGIAESEMLLFRSLVGRPDTFDWANEYLRLPYIPTAITSYEGRLFVFSDRHIFRINPVGFYIEDKIDQVGTYSPRSVVALDNGLVFANAIGAYLYNGQQLTELSAPIADTWKAWAANTIQAVYLPTYMAVMFLKTGTEPSAWVYSLATRRWDYWTFSDVDLAYGNPVILAVPGAFTDSSGVPYIIFEARYQPLSAPTTTYTRLYQLATSSTRKEWSWQGPWMGLGEPGIEKKYYGTKTDSNGTTPAVIYQVSVDNPHSERGFKLIRYTINANGDDEVRSIGVIFRRMEGER